MVRMRAIAFFCLLFLFGCSRNPGGTSVWIDVPRNPITLMEVQPVIIEGHASSPAGVARVEVWVNGDLIQTISSSTASASLATFSTSFTPPGIGEYTIQVIAIAENDQTSQPDSAVLIITQPTTSDTGESPEVEAPVKEPTGEVTSTLTPTPSEVPTQILPEVHYWADPTEIEAGSCTTIHWDTSNVSQVEFGGVVQPPSGSYHDCMCESRTYPLTVTYEDGSDEIFRVTIAVTGSCVTPTPHDTTAPNPPVLLKPLNGSTMNCVADTILRWQAASDPSGISVYQLQVERHPGNYSWQPVPGSVFEVSVETNLLIPVECGYTYRWRVRAEDGAENPSDWSTWFTFTVILS